MSNDTRCFWGWASLSSVNYQHIWPDTNTRQTQLQRPPLALRAKGRNPSVRPWLWRELDAPILSLTELSFQAHSNIGSLSWYNIIEVLSFKTRLGFSLAVVFGDQKSWKCMRRISKNQQHDEMHTFSHPESGLENSVLIHRRMEKWNLMVLPKNSHRKAPKSLVISNRMILNRVMRISNR